MGLMKKDLMMIVILFPQTVNKGPSRVEIIPSLFPDLSIDELNEMNSNDIPTNQLFLHPPE